MIFSGMKSRIQELNAQPEIDPRPKNMTSESTSRGIRAGAGASQGSAAAKSQNTRPASEPMTTMTFRRRIRSTRKMEGIWRICVKGPTAADSPMTVFDAPSRTA